MSAGSMTKKSSCGKQAQAVPSSVRTCTRPPATVSATPTTVRPASSAAITVPAAPPGSTTSAVRTPARPPPPPHVVAPAPASACGPLAGPLAGPPLAAPTMTGWTAMLSGMSSATSDNRITVSPGRKAKSCRHNRHQQPTILNSSSAPKRGAESSVAPDRQRAQRR